MIKRINIDFPQPSTTGYQILMGKDLLLRTKEWLPPQTQCHPIVIVTDHIVKKYYGLALKNQLTKQGYPCLLISFPAGEKSKNIHTKIHIEEKMLSYYCNRNTLLLALGGGVVGDLAGFIAATYMRGIAYLQIPTTLLAMVDSSVGGKTGLDNRFGKNLIGAFYQPKKVVIDSTVLSTLSQPNFINGLIEALKMFLTSDAASFLYFKNNVSKILRRDNIVVTSLLKRAINIKANIIQQDEKEGAQRAILNFGHSIGHALEHLSQYQLPHGVAVAHGLLIESKIAQLLGMLTEKNYFIIKRLLADLGIHPKAIKKFDINQIIKATKQDKKAHAGQCHYVLLTGIGSTYMNNKKFIHPVSNALVKNAITHIREEK